MTVKKFKGGNTLDSSQVYDAATDASLDYIAKRVAFGQPAIGGDLDNCISSGVYSFGPSVSNKPINNSWCYGAVLVIVSDGWSHNNNNNWVWQLCFTTSQLMFMRQKINDNAWSDWKRVTLA